MDETEGMEALKAAYAEVILNTMKEAADRVMESEQKSLRIEQDLQSTKDEALRLLLHLKHMIDAKEAEAEMSSINQQRRIDELEEQLNEAEGLVVDLRAELNLVRDELGEAKKKKKKKTMIVKDDPVLSSMITKYKEAEMYRNGFMERISAVEMSTADEKLQPGDDPCFGAHSKPIRECTETKADVHVEASLKIMKKMENHIHQLKGNVKKDRPTRFHGKIRRRKSCHGKAKANLQRCRNYSSTGNKIDPRGFTATNVEKINTLDNSCVLGEKVQQSIAQSALVRRSVRKRKIKYWDDAASVWRSHDFHSNQCRKVSQPCHKSKPVKCNVKFTEDRLESQSVVEIENHAECIASQHAPEELNRESECTHNTTRDITEQDSHATPLKLEGRLLISDSDAKTSQRSDVTLDQTDTEGRLRYTFSRKRKKNSLINPDENASGEQDTTMADGSPRKNRQLAQVAHQVSDKLSLAI
ncbi:PREDICTED: uncharacterized protein LOC109158327 isoform X2 [Ipomoea nil]|uniref:uncharacterized protein LOC109158327 isoform X2 n=1 Tax=Ipomoea nil TaxID=35883 RepID=UPI0009010379|nr:PREDICTED: uncharacterized protein LOC109158327 isoform X2 [Ipomoea nil]